MAIIQNDSFLQIRVDHSQLDRLVQGALSPEALKRAQTRAINETSAWLKGRLLRELPGLTGIPRKILTRRILQKNAKTGLSGRVTGMVWFGTRPIEAIYLKDEGPSGTGYKAGGIFFEGGFKATLRSGHTGIFARKGAKRLPLTPQKVDIDSKTQECVRRLIRPAELALSQKMNRLINWELERASR